MKTANMSLRHQVNYFTEIRTKYYWSVLLVPLFAILTGVSGQLFIVLPFSPVPITFQTFVVLLSGGLLGKKNGPLSQILFIFLGIIGVPWFAQGTSGIEVILGPTGGYLIGFIIASFFIGWMIEAGPNNRSTLNIIYIAILSNLLIYQFGIVVLILTLHITLNSALLIGLYPFLLGDFIKVISAIFVLSLLSPKSTTKFDDGFQEKGGIYFMHIMSTIYFLFIIFLFSNGSIPPAYLPQISIITVSVSLLTVLIYLKLKVKRSIQAMDY